MRECGRHSDGRDCPTSGPVTGAQLAPRCACFGEVVLLQMWGGNRYIGVSPLRVRSSVKLQLLARWSNGAAHNTISSLTI
jgi:hypothetical protein